MLPLYVRASSPTFETFHLYFPIWLPFASPFILPTWKLFYFGCVSCLTFLAAHQVRMYFITKMSCDDSSGLSLFWFEMLLHEMVGRCLDTVQGRHWIHSYQTLLMPQCESLLFVPTPPPLPHVSSEEKSIVWQCFNLHRMALTAFLFL